MLDTVADLLGIEHNTCPQVVSEATCIASGAHYLIFALSCVLQLKVRVVNCAGTPLDGFTYVGGLGLRYSEGQWFAVKLGTFVASDEWELCATLPFENVQTGMDNQDVPFVPTSDEPPLPVCHLVHTNLQASTGLDCMVTGGSRH
eukprot:6456680-Amphidinium_carterae.2